jgi:eukaryotic-like serine/threonine-protein kinase
MTPQRWQEVERIYQAALVRAGEGRSTFVEEACAGDADLRNEVESLLESHAGAEVFLERPAVELAGESLARQLPWTSFGPYRVIGEIGHGGMGVVYLAERDDGLYSRRVAIKVVSGIGSSELIRRFRMEREILAALDHPNIARLVDAGIEDGGIPYLVMELVEGRPLNAYCEDRKPDTAARCRLFMTICRAVHYAHQHLVIHRDLKPSNILVSDDGVPKLLDFGIAKLLSADQRADEPPTSLLVLTPAYASPEQMLGKPLTTASDVYSLGVLLYELLAGRRPFQFGASVVEAVDVINRENPAKPSVVSGLEGLAGDLDTIVLRAIANQPQERYSSAGELASDLENYLEGRPVLAQRPRWGYLTYKFLRRHRLGAAVAGTAALFLMAFSGIMAIQARRIALERDRANQQAQVSQRVTEFLTGLFRVSDPSEARGNSITAREILDKGSERIVRELNGQPGIQAGLMDTMGVVYQSLGLYDRATPLTENALSTRRRTLGTEHPLVADSLNHLGQLAADKKDLAAAEKFFREALTMRRKLLGNEHVSVASSLSDLAITLRYQETTGANNEAERCYREALAIHRKLLGADDPVVAQNLNNFAMFLYANKRDYAGAEPLFREAVETNRRLLGQDHPEGAKAMNNLALLLRDTHRYDEAEPLFRKALAIHRTAFGESHPQVATYVNNLARLLQLKGDYAAAESQYREAIEVNRKVFPEDHWQIATIKSLLGGCFMDERRYREAEPLLLESYPIIRSSFGPAHNRTVVAGRRIVDLYKAWGKPQKAAEYAAMLPNSAQR